MGVYDMNDLARGTAKMAAFMRERIAAAAPSTVAALGYSNGANILASVLFTSPQLVDRAVLMHPLIPFTPEPQTGLAGRHVLITAGRGDPVAPAESTTALAAWFASQGAQTTLSWHEGGHEVQPRELQVARIFLGT
jgi:phospholipase/carboxylesterase